MSRLLVFLFRRRCSSALSARPAVAAPLTYKLPDETAELKPGPGRGALLSSASPAIRPTTCQHPAVRDKGKAFWDAEVQKMIKVYKAPIPAAGDAAVDRGLSGGRLSLAFR